MGINDFSEGILLICNNDKVSRLVRAITKQEYNAIGFYYKTRISGEEVSRVIIKDLYSLKLPVWSEDVATLEDLLHKSNVEEVVAREITPVKKDGEVDVEATTRRRDAFRVAINRALSNYQEPTYDETIRSLFGVSNEESKAGITNILDDVLHHMGELDNVPRNNKYKQELVVSPPSGGEDSAIERLGTYLGPHPEDTNRWISNYINNGPFEEGVQLEVQGGSSIHEDPEEISHGVYRFVKLLMEDSELADKVNSGIDQMFSYRKKRADAATQALGNSVALLDQVKESLEEGNSHEALEHLQSREFDKIKEQHKQLDK